MIISHKHKFIFIKTVKTAGTSIESFLATYCGDDDIVSFVIPPDEMARRETGAYPLNNTDPKYQIPEEKHQNFATTKDLIDFREKHRYHFASKNFERERILFSPHTSAAKIRKMIGSICWDDYYTFCFDRNPWDRVISAYYFYNSIRNKEVDLATDQDIFNFLSKGVEKKGSICNSLYYAARTSGKIVDDVFDFSVLNDSMQHICDRLEFDFDKYQSMPRLKGQIRKDRRPYDEFLSQKTIDLIHAVHRTAIDTMGYKAKPSKA